MIIYYIKHFSNTAICCLLNLDASPFTNFLRVAAVALGYDVHINIGINSSKPLLYIPVKFRAYTKLSLTLIVYSNVKMSSMGMLFLSVSSLRYPPYTEKKHSWVNWLMRKKIKKTGIAAFFPFVVMGAMLAFFFKVCVSCLCVSVLCSLCYFMIVRERFHFQTLSFSADILILSQICLVFMLHSHIFV